MTTTGDTTSHRRRRGRDAGRRRVERYEPTTIEPSGRQRWEDAPALRHRPDDTRRPQVLPADDVPVPLGRPAHRPLVHQDADRCDRAIPAHARRQRVPADRLRCVRAAGRERRDQEPRSTRATGRWRNIEKMRRPAADAWARRSTGTPRSSPATPSTTAGTSGCSCGSWSRPGRTGRCRPVDWCPNDGTLAREQVEGTDRRCWRCGAKVEKRDLRAVVSADHRLRGRAAGLHGHRLAGAGPADADELDRAQRGRRDRVRDGRRRRTTPAARSCGSSRPARTRCSARRSWSWRPSTRWSRR